MTIIKFDSIVEVSFVIQTLNECSTKRGRHNISNGTRTLASHTIILSEGFMYILRSHCLHLCIPLTLLTKCNCLSVIVFILWSCTPCVTHRPLALRNVFFLICVAVCSFFLLFRASLGKCIEMPTCHEVCVCVQRACFYVCVCEAWLSVLVGWTGKRPSRWARLLLPACWRSCTCLLESALSRSPHAGLPSPVFT